MSHFYKQLKQDKRLLVSFLIILMIPIIFWSISRYPDLIAEWNRSGDNTLLERDVGAISKDEAVKTDRENEAAYWLILKTTWNWIDTNKIGMSFAIIFGGAILAFLGQLSFLRQYLSFGGFKGSFVGMLFGSPLGVCTNCATPVGLALRKDGASLETALSTMFASPMLNPIGLVIIFSVFPLALSSTRLIASLVLIAILIPLATRLLTKAAVCETGTAHSNMSFQAFYAGFDKDSSWPKAIIEAFRLLLQKTWYLVRITVPLMLVAGLLSAVILTYVPLESMVFSSAHGFWIIVVAAALGVLLPTPMFVDIILVLGLLEIGIDNGAAAALLITLGPISIFSASIIWKDMSRQLAINLLLITCAVGIVGGVIVSGYTGIKYQLYAHGYIDKALFADKTQQTGVTGVLRPWPEYNVQSQPPARLFGYGAAWADYDNEGLLDLFVPSGYGNKLYRNLGQEQFVEVTEKSGLADSGYSVSAIWGDYDNDGWTDLYVVNYGPSARLGSAGESDRLYHNNGDGTFSDVSESAGIRDQLHGTGAAWGDYDNDGYIDLYVANWGVWIYEEDGQLLSVPDFNRSELNLFYHNNGDGTFTEKAQALNIAGGIVRQSVFSEVSDKAAKGQPYYSSHSFQPIWFDFNNDNHLDLFVATDYSVSYLYRNNGDGRFSDVTKTAGMDVTTFGMGVAAVDYDGDGYLDLYESNILANHLWHNNRDGTFSEVAAQQGITARKGIGWGVGFFDYDNDRDLDLYVANSFFYANQSEEETNKAWFGIGAINLNRFYENKGDQDFIDATKELGLLSGGFSRGVALADFNNDGFVDIYVVNMFSANKLYVNSGNDNNWITLQLVGTKSNRGGVGARVTVTTEDGYSQTQMLFAGSSFLSCNSPWLTFGLAQAEKVTKMVIHWPSGLRQELHELSINQKHIIQED